MIIFNTTFHVDDSSSEAFTAWLRDSYVPQATASGLMTMPQLTRVLGSERDGGSSLALQLRCRDLATLRHWQQHTGATLTAMLATRFGASVAGFSTTLQKINL